LKEVTTRYRAFSQTDKHAFVSILTTVKYFMISEHNKVSIPTDRNVFLSVTKITVYLLKIGVHRLKHQAFPQADTSACLSVLTLIKIL
jgi:hypothetical protein